MERVLFSVPKLYGDHHVLSVREALLPLAGVEDVYASSAFKRVMITFDAEATSAEALQAVLVEAGYVPDEQFEFAAPTPGKEDGSFWHTWYPRDTKTNLLDLEMSGDFRKY